MTTPTTVMITGATGYVAGWIVKGLLDAGHTVHAPVRDPNNADKTGPLQALADAAPGNIKFFKADLLDEGSYDAAAAGCSVIFHTASPFTLKFKDAQKDLIDPALNGTRNVLATANRTDSVRRVVLTSSCAAIYGDNADMQDMPGKIMTEQVWNTSSSLEHNPYSYSKTVAEKAAWEMAEAQDRWKLVVVNPSLVLGPATNPQHATSESFDLIKQYADGRLKMGVPHIGVCCIDVRDLAQAHMAAAFKDGANGRNIISSTDTTLMGIAEVLRPTYGKTHPLPKSHAPKWLVWLVGPFQGFSRKFVSRNVGYDLRADNSKAVRELDLTFTPFEQTLNEMFAQMIEAGRT